MVTQPFLSHKGDDVYPDSLSDLEDPPLIWVVGSLTTDPAVAVVGTRRATKYGLTLAEQFGLLIARAGWVTVSGLARGIDTAAHRGCVDSGGVGVAVLGSGIDVCYPPENRSLYDELITTGGAIVSEYGPGTPPDRWRFPARNRLIAALASAIVVVESAEKGGALITARLGAEMGRPVFVVPGDVDRPMSEGCNRLIKDGAHPLLGPVDLVEELSLVLGPPVARSETNLDIPIDGVAIGDLPDLWGLTLSQAMVRLGRLELAGSVRRVGEMLFPR